MQPASAFGNELLGLCKHLNKVKVMMWWVITWRMKLREIQGRMIGRLRAVVRNKLWLSCFTSRPPSPPSFCCCVSSSRWLGANAFKSQPSPPRSVPRAWAESRRKLWQLEGLGKERTTPAVLTLIHYKWTSLVGSQIPMVRTTLGGKQKPVAVAYHDH